MNDQLQDFLHYLIVEKRLSKNTIAAYKQDLKAYLEYLKSRNIESMQNVSREHILEHLAHLQNENKALASIARTVSSIKAFHQFLYRDEILSENVTIHIHTPKIKKRMPKVLSQKEVEQL